MKTCDVCDRPATRRMSNNIFMCDTLDCWMQYIEEATTEEYEVE